MKRFLDSQNKRRNILLVGSAVLAGLIVGTRLDAASVTPANAITKIGMSLR